MRVIFVVRHRPAFQSPSAPPTTSSCRKQVNCATHLPPAVDPLSYVYPAITFRDGPGTVQIWFKQLIIGLRAQLYEFACPAQLHPLAAIHRPGGPLRLTYGGHPCREDGARTTVTAEVDGETFLRSVSFPT